MNKFENITKPLMWFMALLLAAFVAGCNSGGGGGGAGDITAPTVSHTVPLNADLNAMTNSKITATFSENMDPATITGTTFTLMNTTLGTAVTGNVTYAAGAKTAIFAPTATLPINTAFTATITTAATDVAGNALAVAKTWSFATVTATDAAAPTVSSTTPVDLATDVSINANIVATFSEAMDPSTITSVTFTLKQGATPVSGAVTYVGTNAIFNPTSNLATNTTYTATVTTGVMDLAGLQLTADKVWTFTTGTMVSAGPDPVILGTAGNYAILTKTGITTTGITAVTGDIGTSPAAATYIQGFGTLPLDGTGCFSTSTLVVGNVYAADYNTGVCTTPADLTTAVLNMEAAYTDAAGRTATSAATTNVGGGTLANLTLAPGVYEWGSNVNITTDLALNGAATDVWIFKVTGTLDMASNKNVILSGALSKNIFWQVADVVTIGTGAHFEGIVLGQTAIVMTTGASINGRLLAQTAVTLDATTVTQPAP